MFITNVPYLTEIKRVNRCNQRGYSLDVTIERFARKCSNKVLKETNAGK